MSPFNSATATKTRSAELTNTFLRSIYNWMALALAVTAGVSLFLTKTIAGASLIFGSNIGMYIPFACLLATVGLSFFLSMFINKISATTATLLFLLFSVLMGAGLAPVLLAYTDASVMQAFASAAGMFLAISIYGLVTKRDLASVGSFCTMALFGLIIAMIVNWFVGSSMLDMAISAVGVLIFVGLTAYETQLYKRMGDTMPNDALAIHRATIFGALNLYMNFINLFLMLLRLFGDRR